MSKKILVRRFKKPIKVYAFTDVHIGAKSHDKKKFDKAIKALKADKDAYCFFNGDNLEFIPPNYGIPEGGQDKSTDEQIEIFANLLKELGDKVLFFRSGNHEERAWRLGGVEIAKHLSRETGVPFLSSGMEETHVFIGKRKIRLVTHHGEGGGSKKILTNMALTFPGADLYFSGHTHELYCNESNMTINTSDSTEIFQKQVDMVGGSFLGWADYSRSRGMRPTATGCYILKLTEQGLSVHGKVS